jgi:hypothetical protein
MKKKLIPATIYAGTFAALVVFFDALYGGGPVTRNLWLIRLAIFGTVLFACACIASLFSVRMGVICGLGASTLALPYFVLLARAVPWGNLFSALPHAEWRYVLTAIVALACSIIYSITSVSRAFRSAPSV